MIYVRPFFFDRHASHSRLISSKILGENFFQYACGAWNKKNVIPEDKSSFSTFEVCVCVCCHAVRPCGGVINDRKRPWHDCVEFLSLPRYWPINSKPFCGNCWRSRGTKMIMRPRSKRRNSIKAAWISVRSRAGKRDVVEEISQFFLDHQM